MQQNSSPLPKGLGKPCLSWHGEMPRANALKKVEWSKDFTVMKSNRDGPGKDVLLGGIWGHLWQQDSTLVGQRRDYVVNMNLT